MGTERDPQRGWQNGKQQKNVFGSRQGTKNEPAACGQMEHMPLLISLGPQPGDTQQQQQQQQKQQQLQQQQQEGDTVDGGAN